MSNIFQFRPPAGRIGNIKWNSNPYLSYSRPRQFPANDPMGVLGRNTGKSVAYWRTYQEHKPPRWLRSAKRAQRTAIKGARIANLAGDLGMFGIAEKLWTTQWPRNTGPKLGPLTGGGFRHGIVPTNDPTKFDFRGFTVALAKPTTGPAWVRSVNPDQWFYNILAPVPGTWRWMYPGPGRNVSFGQYQYDFEWIWPEGLKQPRAWVREDPVPRQVPIRAPRPRLRVRNRPGQIEAIQLDVFPNGRLALDVNPAHHRPPYRYSGERKYNGLKAGFIALQLLESAGDVVELSDVFADAYNIPGLKRAGFLDYDTRFEKWAHTLRHMVRDLADDGQLNGLDEKTARNGILNHLIWEKVGSKLGQLQRQAATSLNLPLDSLASPHNPAVWKEVTGRAWSIWRR